MTDILIAVAGVLAILATSYYLPRLFARFEVRHKAARPTITALGAAPVGRLIKGDFEGQAYEIEPASDRSPARLRLLLPGVAHGAVVTHNWAWARFLTRTGFIRPARSGDDTFDHFYYVASEDRDFAAAWLGRSGVRAKLERFLVGSRSPVILSGERLVVPLPKKVLTAPDGADRIREALRDACPLASEAKLASRSSAPAVPTRRPLAVSAVLIGLPVSMALGMLSLKWMRQLFPADVVAALTLGGWISLAGFLSLQLWVVLSCAGRSDAHRSLQLAFFGGLLVVPMLVFGGLFGGNAVLDRSPVRRVEARILRLKLDKEANDRKGGWDLFVESWREGRKIDLLHPTKAEAEALFESSHVDIQVRDGAFGWERVVTIGPGIAR